MSLFAPIRALWHRLSGSAPPAAEVAPAPVADVPAPGPSAIRVRFEAAERACLEGRWQDVLTESDAEFPPAMQKRMAVARITALAALGWSARLRAELAAFGAHDPSPAVLARIAATLMDRAAWVALAEFLIDLEARGHFTVVLYAKALKAAAQVGEPDLARDLGDACARFRRDQGFDHAQDADVSIVAVTRNRMPARARAAIDPPDSLIFEMADPGMAWARDEIAGYAAAFAKSVRRPRLQEYVTLHDVFVNRYRQVWRADGTVIEANGRPVAPLDPDEAVPEVAAALHPGRGTRGFFHWMMEDVPTLALLNLDNRHALDVLISAHLPGFARQTVELMAIPGVRARVYDTGAVFCRTLYLPAPGPRNMGALPVAWHLYQRMVERALAVGGAPTPERIYMTRRGSPRRALGNDAALAAALADRGYVTLDFADLTLAEQIRHAVGVRSLVTPHGAGLSHMIFMQPGATVLELMPVQPGHMNKRGNFARLSRLCGLTHAIWLEPINPMTLEWSVPIERVLALADRLA